MIWTRLDTNILSSQSTNLEYDVISNIVSLLKRAFIKINLSKCSYVNCVEWMRYIRSLSFPVIKTFGVTDWKKDVERFWSDAICYAIFTFEMCQYFVVINTHSFRLNLKCGFKTWHTNGFILNGTLKIENWPRNYI